MNDRLQKVLARAGCGSRRACEEIIADGRVKVNGKVATLGAKADREVDKITVDNQPIPAKEPLKYIAFHKPQGVLSTVGANDPRPTVRDFVHVAGRLYPVGRLDVDSEGLILMTNDGKLTNRLTHPRYEHEKEYLVQVAGLPTPAQLNAWRQGIALEDGTRTLPTETQIESTKKKKTWLRVVLKEGRNRQIRRMGANSDLPVQRLIRVRIASLCLNNLPPRKWRHLTPEEVKALRKNL